MENKCEECGVHQQKYQKHKSLQKLYFKKISKANEKLKSPHGRDLNVRTSQCSRFNLDTN